MQGIVNLCDEEEDGSLSFHSLLEAGRALGERGILRKENRSLTAYARTRVHLITLDSHSFHSILGNSTYILQEQKM